MDWALLVPLLVLVLALPGPEARRPRRATS
jgi:hypothetical protein